MCGRTSPADNTSRMSRRYCPKSCCIRRGAEQLPQLTVAACQKATSRGSVPTAAVSVPDRARCLGQLLRRQPGTRAQRLSRPANGTADRSATTVPNQPFTTIPAAATSFSTRKKPRNKLKRRSGSLKPGPMPSHRVGRKPGGPGLDTARPPRRQRHDRPRVRQPVQTQADIAALRARAGPCRIPEPDTLTGPGSSRITPGHNHDHRPRRRRSMPPSCPRRSGGHRIGIRIWFMTWSPLRNRTVDLLLTINCLAVPSPQVRARDQAGRKRRQALASPGHAYASAVCHSICHSL